ncbi:MAG: hypothetical protein WA771_05050 [Chthoniobacterales bacterium]
MTPGSRPAGSSGGPASFEVENDAEGEGATVTLLEGTTNVPAALEETSPELELTESEERQKNRLARDFLDEVNGTDRRENDNSPELNGGRDTAPGTPAADRLARQTSSSYPSAEALSNDRFRVLFGDEALNAQGRRTNEENARLTR